MIKCSFYRSDHFTSSQRGANAAASFRSMEKLNDKAKITMGGADRRSDSRDSRHGSREPFWFAASSSSRRGEYHANSPICWGRGSSSRIRRSRCVGTLGPLLWTHASVHSVTSSPAASIDVPSRPWRGPPRHFGGAINMASLTGGIYPGIIVSRQLDKIS